ncbi:hypothetical protein F4781DRAFT_384515 [Annulohypoxylon bovei var. microspora]|nr:hypothetical protein F4781DRAFT_384515 [Annulohypoxylon bovei var. microspora]
MLNKQHEWKNSTLAQRKRAGLITRRSSDRNGEVLSCLLFLFSFSSTTLFSH